MKINFHGISAALTSLLALGLQHSDLLPPKAAAVVAAAGIVYQAFSKPAAEKPTP